MAYLMLAAAIACWGGSFRAIGIATDHAPGLVVAGIRTAASALVLLALLPFLRSRLPRGRDALFAALTGVLMVTLFYYFLTDGTARAGAANASVLSNSTPFWVLLFGSIFFAERITRVGLVGLVTGFVGVVVMVSSQLGGGDARDVV